MNGSEIISELHVLTSNQDARNAGHRQGKSSRPSLAIPTSAIDAQRSSSWSLLPDRPRVRIGERSVQEQLQDDLQLSPGLQLSLGRRLIDALKRR